MITEDYVSFETAKLLKENGFNEACRSAYTSHGCFRDIEIKEFLTNKTCPDTYWECVAPTLQMAMKWMREVYDLCIEPYRTACGYLYTISTIPYGSCKYNPREGGDDEDSGQWTTYEKACEAAIKYCIENLI